MNICNRLCELLRERNIEYWVQSHHPVHPWVIYLKLDSGQEMEINSTTLVSELTWLV